MSSSTLLPSDVLLHIFEFNLQHRENMKWVLHDIRNSPFCQVCHNIIIKHIYSRRNCDMVCCSVTCVENCSSFFYS